MKKNIPSIIIYLVSLLLLFTTFFIQYEYLFTTRIVTIFILILLLIIQFKKGFFSANKNIFILVSTLSLIALVVSIIFDNSLPNSGNSDRDFLIPVFVLIFIIAEYRDLYDKNKK